MSNSLLDDLLEEDHAWALSGNKKIPKKEQIRNTNNWTDDKSWVSEGYIAHVFVTHCTRCSLDSKHFWGIFHRERSPSGSVKEVKLQGKIQIPAGQWPVRLIQSPDTHICAHCMDLNGFSVNNAPTFVNDHAEIYTHGKL